MKTLLVVSLALLVFACQDVTPVQPDLEEGPELLVAQAPGGGNNVVKMVPFKSDGTWWAAGMEFSGCRGDPTLLSVFIEGEGTAMHLGRYQASWTVCWTYGFEFVSTGGSFTAASGDRLEFYGSTAENGTTHPFYPDNTWDVGPIMLVGGTGRFHDAEGWLDCVGDNNDAITEGVMICQGKVSSVGSSR